MRKMALIVCLFIIAVGLSACVNNQNSNGDDNIVIKGKVMDRSISGDVVLVDSVTEGVVGEISITITEDTSFKADNKEFNIGNEVEIILDGEIAESYPMQAKAKEVIVNNPNP